MPMGGGPQRPLATNAPPAATRRRDPRKLRATAAKRPGTATGLHPPSHPLQARGGRAEIRAADPPEKHFEVFPPVPSTAAPKDGFIDREEPGRHRHNAPPVERPD